MDYGRMDMVNGNYMEENNRRMAEEEQRRKAEEELRRAEELRMEEQRLEEERRTAVMRGNFPFSDGPARCMPCFTHSVCIKMHRGSPTLFRRRNPYLFWLMYQKVRGSIEKRQYLHRCEHAPAGRIRFPHRQSEHTAHYKNRTFSSRHQPDASSVFR